MLKRERDGHAAFDSEQQNDPVSGDDASFAKGIIQFWVNRLSCWGKHPNATPRGKRNTCKKKLTLHVHHLQENRIAIVTPALIKALFTGFRNDYQDTLEAAPAVFNQVATITPSSTASNTYDWLVQFPKLREWVGERQLKDIAVHVYAIANKLYESKLGVERTDIEDDNLGIYGPLF